MKGPVPLSPSFVTQQWPRQELDILRKLEHFIFLPFLNRPFNYLENNINNAKSNQEYCSPSPNFQKVRVVRNSTKNSINFSTQELQVAGEPQNSLIDIKKSHDP